MERMIITSESDPDMARELRETIAREVIRPIVRDIVQQSETVRFLGQEYKVGGFVNIVGRGIRQIVKIENGVGHLREPKPGRVVPQKRPANRPWYQQHDKRKWK